jgi:Galactose oxidase, central domain
MNTRSRLLPLATAVLLGFTLAGTGCARHDRQAGPAATPTTSTPSATPSPTASVPPGATPGTTAGTWRQIAGAPVPSGSYLAVWTGNRLLIHEPDYRTGRGSNDAAYTPSTGTWQKLPSSRFAVRSTEAGSAAVWDGTEMLTFGVLNAAYNPSTRAWRALSPPPLAGPSVVVWTGSRVLVFGGGCCDDATNHGASYDPAADRWTAIPVAPLAPRHTAGVWTGRELVVVGGQAHEDSFFADAAAYNPATRTWRKLPSLPAPRFFATVTWTGRDVLVVGGQSDFGAVPYTSGYAYTPGSNRWRALPAMDTGRSAHVAVWTGSRLIVWGGFTRTARDAVPTKPAHGLILDPVRRTWSAMPKAPVAGRRNADAFWTGNRMLLWGGSTVADLSTVCMDGATYQMP